MSCSQDNPITVSTNVHSDTEKINFKLKIDNISKTDILKLSNGTTQSINLSQGVWTVYSKNNPIFTAGQKDDGKGLESLAEDGNATTIETSIKSKDGVVSTGLFNSLKPGESIEISFSANNGSKLSFASMLDQSNDLFYSTTGIDLFDADKEPIKGDLTSSFSLFDSGTEVNQEPGLGSDQAPRQSAINIGQAESNVIQNIDLVKDGFTYPKTSDVIKVTLTNDDVHEHEDHDHE